MPRRNLLALLVTGDLCFLPAAWSQEFRATLISTVSNDDGLYQTPFLDLGRYSVTAAAPGFKTEVKNNLD